MNQWCGYCATQRVLTDDASLELLQLPGTWQHLILFSTATLPRMGGLRPVASSHHQSVSATFFSAESKYAEAIMENLARQGFKLSVPTAHHATSLLRNSLGSHYNSMLHSHWILCTTPNGDYAGSRRFPCNATFQTSWTVLFSC